MSIPDPAGLTHFKIDTGAMGREAGYAFWRQAHGVLFEANEDPPEIVADFVTDVTIYNAGPMLVGGGGISPQRFSRTAAIIARDGIDHYFLLMCRTGAFSGACDGVHIHIGPGDVCLFNFTSTADIGSQSTDCIALAMPRHLLGPMLSNPDGVSGTVLHRGQPLCDVTEQNIAKRLPAVQDRAADTVRIGQHRPQKVSRHGQGNTIRRL